jgi:hypothetical protein
MPLTREEIRYGYLYILGRDPESERVYDLFAKQASVLDFRRSLIRSDEGQQVIRSQLPITVKHPYFDLDRVAVCFIHSSHLAMDALHSLSLSEITKYDLIAGHFDYATTLALPRPQIKRIALFRDPIDRLISFYRFHKAHPIAKRRMNFVELAQDLTPLEFFRHEQVRSSPRLNNAYLRTFGSCLSLPVARETKGNETSKSLELAATRIREMDAVGITESMQESVTLICQVLGFVPPEEMHRHHRTDDFATRNQGFSKPEPIERSAELEAAIEPLISIDLDLYRVAKQTFWSRLAALNKERTAQ